MNEATRAATSARAGTKWLRAGLSAAALAYIFHKTPLHMVIAVLQTANPWLLCSGVCLNVATRWAAAERTQVMNAALGLQVTRRQTIVTLFISNFYGLLSPGPWLSGVVTVYRYNHLGASMTGSVSSLLSSRAIEAVVFVFWGVVFALCDQRLAFAAARTPLLLAVLALALAGLAAMLWFMAHRRHIASPIVAARQAQAHESLWQRLRRQVGGVVSQMLVLGPGVALRAAVPASLQVFMSAVALALLANSIGVPLTWISGGWMAAAVYAVVLLPISVAGIGVREFTLISAFALLGFSSQAAVAVALLLLLDILVSGCIGAVLQATTSLARRRVRATP